ncbi:MAG TPA: VWA domain-containing protein [Acetobacteraceae bacterium]|nr:VWA domain-containing protein [Acetobacteraceae bacterium]
MATVTSNTMTSPAPAASEPLRRFLQVARGAGLRVSAAEGIDAARAVDVVGFSDRTVLKDTLSLVLAKTPEEKGLFEECFELYFRRDEFASPDAVEPPLPEPMSAPDPAMGGDGVGGQGGAALGQTLLDDDRAALAAAMEQAARDAGLENIRFFTQKNLYARRILDRMGLRAVEREIDGLRASGNDQAMVRADRLEARLEMLRDALRDFVERHLVLFARGETEAFREELLRNARLSNLERRDLERMRVLVRAMAKKLAARYAKTRRRRLRGQLDVRRTLRRNMGWGGVPFITVWKQKRIEKPRVMVLCDVSGSVAPMAQFLLMFLYAVHEALSDIRSFAFAGSLIEVSDVLEKHEIEAAIDEIMKTIGYGSSNYGNSLADFEDGWGPLVTNKTTIIVLGDARGNRTDPRTEIMARLSQRAKRIIWLNPEYRSAWGTGDSDMYRYAAFCNVVTVCNTLRHLERVVTDLLEQAA